MCRFTFVMPRLRHWPVSNQRSQLPSVATSRGVFPALLPPEIRLPRISTFRDVTPRYRYQQYHFSDLLSPEYEFLELQHPEIFLLVIAISQDLTSLHRYLPGCDFPARLTLTICYMHSHSRTHVTK